MENSFHERNENSIFPSKQTLKKNIDGEEEASPQHRIYWKGPKKKNTQKKIE